MARRMSTRVAELAGQGVPFVHATVVRAQPPTSARPGDDAVVLADGSLEGFVGGQCAMESVRVAALGALEEGNALLLRILPDGEDGFADAEGARVVVNPCLSGGALEIFLEPMFPSPQIAVVGDTPTAEAVTRVAGPLGFSVESVPSLADRPPEGALAVILASHGHDEPESIRAALDAGVGFIGLVASRRRGEAVLEAMELTADERARVHTPVGLEIGARTPEEIALSIMAQVVRDVRLGGLRAPKRELTAKPVQFTDPVCGMTVVVGPDTPHRVIGGRDVWFCSAGCRDSFAA